MDAFNPTHLSRETLRACSLGRLDDTSTESVSEHVEQCDECQRVMAEMAPDTFVDRLREVQSGPLMSSSGAELPAELSSDQGGGLPDTHDFAACACRQSRRFPAISHPSPLARVRVLYPLHRNTRSLKLRHT